jgi:hypothetical protein
LPSISLENPRIGLGEVNDGGVPATARASLGGGILPIRNLKMVSGGKPVMRMFAKFGSVYVRPGNRPAAVVVMFSAVMAVMEPAVTSTVNEPLAEPPGSENTTFDRVKVTRSALAAVDPANAAYAAMIENAATAALSFDFMAVTPQ